jgi:multicomponent Na+:H+ antiporter subunit D
LAPDPSSVHILIGLAVAAPWLAAALILLLPRRLTEPVSYAAALVTATCAGLLLRPVLAGESFRVEALRLLPGMSLEFRVDALGMTFALLASGLWIVTTVYSSGYVRADDVKHRKRYFASFAAAIGAAAGIAFAGNLLTFFLFYEALTLSTYPLVVHKESAKAFAAGRRYLFFALGGGLALLTAIVATWSITGTLDFVPGGFMHGAASPFALTVLFGLFLLGVGSSRA